MKFHTILLTSLIFFSAADAKNYFIHQKDICDTHLDEQCTNDFNVVRNLQITLSHDKYSENFIKADGKWGKNTKDAVIAFQENHNLKPADGWVGISTKKALDKIARNIKFPKDIKIATPIVAKITEKTTKTVKMANNKKLSKSTFGSYAAFKKSVNLRKSFKIFENKLLLKKATGRNTKLTIDISEQRVKLIVNGKVALSSPCTTGAKRKFEPNTKIYRDKRTPKGIFKITEKISDKRSTIFGKFYRNGKVVYKGDRRKYRGPKAKYKGASLQNWMRLTSGGIGLHASKYVKRNPGTNGCIRLPYKVSKTIFKNVRRGTKVSIVN